MSGSWSTGQKPKKQFSRPGVDLDRHGRSWQSRAASTIEEGDLISNYGTVTKVLEEHGEEESTVTITFTSGGQWSGALDHVFPMVFAL